MRSVYNRKNREMLLQRDTFYLYAFLAKEDGGGFFEFAFAFRSQEAAVASLGATGIHLRMALQIRLQALGYIFSLCNDADIRGGELPYLVQQQWVVGASQYDGINLWVFLQKAADVLLYKIIGSLGLVFVVFYQWNPQGASFPHYCNIGKEFMYFQRIGFGFDSTGSGKYTYVPASGNSADAFGSGADHAKNSTSGVYHRKINLLDGA